MATFSGSVTHNLYLAFTATCRATYAKIDVPVKAQVFRLVMTAA
jgi:hypothetical protein